MRHLPVILVLLSSCSAFGGGNDASTDAAMDASAADVRVDVVVPTTDASDAALAPVTCALLGNDCGGNHACYPFPFESRQPTGTMCGLQGTGTDRIYCASQLDCDAQSICISPGESDGICLTRCDPNYAFCAVGEAVRPRCRSTPAWASASPSSYGTYGHSHWRGALAGTAPHFVRPPGGLIDAYQDPGRRRHDAHRCRLDRSAQPQRRRESRRRGGDEA